MKYFFKDKYYYDPFEHLTDSLRSEGIEFSIEHKSMFYRGHIIMSKYFHLLFIKTFFIDSSKTLLTDKPLINFY